jgi:hypothetical protein
MAKYDNTNSGAIFKNDRKETESHPDMTGTLDVEGTEYRISGWFNEKEGVGKYMRVKLTKKEAPKATASAASEEIPF